MSLVTLGSNKAKQDIFFVEISFLSLLRDGLLAGPLIFQDIKDCMINLMRWSRKQFIAFWYWSWWQHLLPPLSWFLCFLDLYTVNSLFFSPGLFFSPSYSSPMFGSTSIESSFSTSEIFFFCTSFWTSRIPSSVHSLRPLGEIFNLGHISSLRLFPSSLSVPVWFSSSLRCRVGLGVDTLP